MLAQHSAVDHLALDVERMQGDNPQLDKTVGKKDAGSRFEILRQGREGRADKMGGSRHIARGDGELLPGFEMHRKAILQPAGANLRALQVAHDADWLVLFARDLAHHLDQFQLFRVRSMRKVEAGNIEAGSDKLTKYWFLIRRRAKRPDDFRAATLIGESPGLRSTKLKLIHPP